MRPRAAGGTPSLPFIGQEFLLWLYWRSAEDPYYYLESHGIGNVDLVLEEQITLESLSGEGYRETIQTQEVASHGDVRSSIGTGRIPVAARVKVSRGQVEWRFTLTAFPLTVRSVRLPSVDTKGDDDEEVYRRLIHLEEIDHIMRTIFQIFLIERTNETFVATMRGILGLE